MKHQIAQFVTAVQQWDATHRIVGRENVSLLVAQSVQALQKLQTSTTLPPCLVDVGAGSGILGFAWLFIQNHHQVVFVEPRKKSVGFLHFFLATQPSLAARSRVISSKIESVSRETLLKFSPGGFFCSSRAFSGGSSFEEALRASELKSDLAYVFVPDIAHSAKPQYVLRQISSTNQ